MCKMFCGWRLNTSLPQLLKLGSGSLEIDGLTGHCFFQGVPSAQLRIAEEISIWLRDDLAANDISVSLIASARLTVGLTFSIVPWNSITKEIFFLGGQAARTETMNRCAFECGSSVMTNDREYTSNLIEAREWPMGWPKP